MHVQSIGRDKLMKVLNYVTGPINNPGKKKPPTHGRVAGSEDPGFRMRGLLLGGVPCWITIPQTSFLSLSFN